MCNSAKIGVAGELIFALTLLVLPLSVAAVDLHQVAERYRDVFAALLPDCNNTNAQVVVKTVKRGSETLEFSYRPYQEGAFVVKAKCEDGSCQECRFSDWNLAMYMHADPSKKGAVFLCDVARLISKGVFATEIAMSVDSVGPGIRCYGPRGEKIAELRGNEVIHEELAEKWRGRVATTIPLGKYLWKVDDSGRSQAVFCGTNEIVRGWLKISGRYPWIMGCLPDRAVYEKLKGGNVQPCDFEFCHFVIDMRTDKVEFMLRDNAIEFAREHEIDIQSMHSFWHYALDEPKRNALRLNELSSVHE